MTDETRQSPAEAATHKRERALTEMVLATWRNRFPNNCYAWPGAPESFAIQAVRTVVEQLTVSAQLPASIPDECYEMLSNLRGHFSRPEHRESGRRAYERLREAAAEQLTRSQRPEGK